MQIAADEAIPELSPASGKVFKQITDSWGEKASPGDHRAQKRATRRSSKPR